MPTLLRSPQSIRCLIRVCPSPSLHRREMEYGARSKESECLAARKFLHAVLVRVDHVLAVRDYFLEFSVSDVRSPLRLEVPGWAVCCFSSRVRTRFLFECELVERLDVPCCGQ
jgi:hypothetical protein